MKKTKLILLIFALGFIFEDGWSQHKWDKRIRKSESAYAKGAYDKALRTLEKTRKQSTKKLGPLNPYLPLCYLLTAKNYQSLGKILTYESNLKVAIKLGDSIYSKNGQRNGELIMDVAELSLQNGEYRKAKDFLNQSMKILKAGNFMTEPVQARWDVLMAEALAGQGFYRESLDLAQSKLSYFDKRAIKKEFLTDASGNLISKKLPKAEFLKRFEEYARLLTLIAHTYSRQGELKKADSAFVGAATWMGRNWGYNNLPYVRNQFLNANMLTENGNESLPSELQYDNLISKATKAVQPNHVIVVELNEAYLKYLLKTKSGSYLNAKLRYQSLLRKSYGPTSLFGVRFNATELASSTLQDDAPHDVESEANGVISSLAVISKNNIMMADLLEFVYKLSIRKKNYALAEGYLSKIVDLKTNLFGEEAPETHLAKVKLADFYLDYTNKIPEAGTIYANSFEKIVSREIGPWHKDLLTILNHVATYNELTDHYAEASSALDKASAISRAKYDNKDFQYGDELTSIARLQLKLGQYEQAEENITGALKILEDYSGNKEKRIYLVHALEVQATLFGIKGLFEEARSNLDRANRIIKRTDQILGIDELSAAGELSGLFLLLGQYADAQKQLNKLLTESEKLYGSTSLRLIEPLSLLGRLSLVKGDYAQAQKMAERSSQIGMSVYGEKSTKMASVFLLLGDIDNALADYESAVKNYEKAIQNLEKQFHRSHVEVARALSLLALVKFYKGDDKIEIEKMLTEAHQIISAKLGADNPLNAEILKNLAVLYISQNKNNQAFSLLTQAYEIWRSKIGTTNNINTAILYVLTGDVYYQIKNFDKAEEFYKNASDIYEKYFSRSHPDYVKVLSRQARVDYMQKQYKRAKKNIEEALNNYDVFIKKYFHSLSDREKAKYWNSIKGDFEFYNTLAFGNYEDFRDLAGKVYNYQLLTKALLLNSSIKTRERILNSTDEKLKASYLQWIQKKDVLTRALSMSHDQLVQNGIDPDALSADVEKLERELGEKSELFSHNLDNKKITYENVQSALGKNEVAVEIVRYRYFNHTLTDSIIYVALSVKNDKARPKVIQLPEGYRMENHFYRYYRNCITSKITDAHSYKVFWQPIQEGIGQYATLNLSPDGVYNLINLESIPTPDGKYVIDNSNVQIVSNTKDLFLRKNKVNGATPGNTASIFGNPQFYLTASAANTIPGLPGTEKEANELQTLLNQKGWTTTEYMDASATEERVKEQESPKIFHIATHGFYINEKEKKDGELIESEAEKEENPLMKTGLLLKGAGDLLNKTRYNFNLENGILTAYEAMNLNLDKTDLVVLSACETGLGEISNGEGVYGLQRAFLVAGAKVLIMSMFKVDDEATQKLILSFYRKWLISGNLRQSFREAQMELRMEYPDPIYWGSFMMIGLD